MSDSPKQPRHIEGDIPRWVFDGPTAHSCSALCYREIVLGTDAAGAWWWRIQMPGGSDYADAWSRGIPDLATAWRQALRVLREEVLKWPAERAWPAEACWRRVGGTPPFPVEDGACDGCPNRKMVGGA